MVSEKQKRQVNIGARLSTKAVVQLPKPKKKKSVKEIANTILKEMETEKAPRNHPKKNPGPRELHYNRVTTKELKLMCKYRKSCYKTGVLEKRARTEIDEHKKIIRKEKQEKTFADMEPYEKKLFCRYRNSCYASGISPKKAEDSSAAGQSWLPIVQNYLAQYQRQDQRSETTKVKPANVKQFKLFCRYRKSCYKEQAGLERKTAPGVEKVPAEVIAEIVSEPKKEVQKPQQKPQEEKERKENKLPQPTQAKKSRAAGKGSEIPVAKRTIKVPSRKAETAIKGKPITKDMPKTQSAGKSGHSKAPKQEQQKKATLAGSSKAKPDKKESKTVGKPDASKERAETTRKMKKYTPIIKKAENPELQKLREWAKRATARSRSLMTKLTCRYRKSCYQTGRLPEFVKNREQRPSIDEGSSEKKTAETFTAWFAVPSDVQSNKKQEKIEGWNRLKKVIIFTTHRNNFECLKVDRMRLCHYRKSCYERQEELADSEKEDMPLETIMVRKVSPTSHSKSTAGVVDLGTKLGCKYRKSCYATAEPKKEYQEVTRNKGIRIVQEVPKAIGDDENCNKFRISCRKKLGLPVTERAPTGPNGKKLCRKRKPADSNS